MTAMAQVEILRAACCLAGADQNVDDSERALLKQLAAKVGVGKASLDAMILRAETEPNFYEKQFQVLKTSPESTMQVLLQVATDNRKVEAAEVEMLKHFADRLGMDAESFQRVALPAMKQVEGNQ